jgi:hypothetical protein
MPLVSDFLIKLLMQEGQSPLLAREMFYRTWFYVSKTNFLFDLASLMLSPLSYPFPLNKTTQSYRTPTIDNVIGNEPNRLTYKAKQFSRDYILGSLLMLPEDN